MSHSRTWGYGREEIKVVGVGVHTLIEFLHYSAQQTTKRERERGKQNNKVPLQEEEDDFKFYLFNFFHLLFLSSHVIQSQIL